LPNASSALARWHGVIREAVEERRDDRLHTVIRRLQKLIDDDPVARMYMTEMIQQVPKKYRSYHPQSLGGLFRQVRRGDRRGQRVTGGLPVLMLMDSIPGAKLK
jgi:phosphatidylserine decarboxylase